MKIAFFGGIETPRPKESSIDEEDFAQLLTHSPGEIDILITHDAPYGIGTNFLGQEHGSAQITQLVETIQPQYLIAGHYHHMIGPTMYGRTKYLGLNVLIHLRLDPSGRVQPGCLAILDTEKDELNFVTDDWLAGFVKVLILYGIASK
jgi:hypothetical protein